MVQKLVEKKRQKDDIGIEDFSNADGPLPKVTRDDVLNWRGVGEDTEKALLAILRITNKGIAHFTESFQPEDADRVKNASIVIPFLVSSYVYARLNLPTPK